MNSLLIATKAAAVITALALLSTETMGGLAADAKEAVMPSAQASTVMPTRTQTRVEVGQVLYSAEGKRLGAIRAVGRYQGEYTMIYLANATFQGEDVSVVDGRVQLRGADIDMAQFVDEEQQMASEQTASLIDSLPR